MLHGQITKHMHLAVAVGVKRLVLYAPREASSGDVFPSCNSFKYGSFSQYGGSLVPLNFPVIMFYVHCIDLCRHLKIGLSGYI